MISGKFIKSSFLFTVGGAMPMASGLVLLPFYTNRLTIETYGILMLYVVFSLFMQSVTSYALDAFLGVQYVEAQHDRQKLNKIIGAIAGLMLVIGSGVIVAGLLVGEPLFNVSFNSAGNLDFYPWGIMSIVTGFFNGFFKTATNLLVFRREAWTFLGFNFINFLLTIAISLVGLHLYPGELTGPMHGRLLSGLGIFIMSMIFIIKEYGINFSFGSLKGLHSFCMPYLIYLILVWIVTNIDRYIINGTLDSGTVGLYDFAVRCTLLISLIQDGLVAAINPLVYTIWKDNGKNETTPESNRYFNVYAAVGVIFISGFSLVIPLAIPFVVSNASYYDAFIFMGAIAAGFATRGLYHYFLLPILYLKKTRLLAIAFGLSAAIQVPLTYWMADQYGLNGVVIANVVSKVVQALFLFAVLKPHFKIKFNIWKLLVMPAVFIALYLFVWLYYDVFIWWIYGILLMITAMVVGLLYFNEIKLTLSKFVNKGKAN